jgi:ferric-dicitrate binding protein FerR (iron transport regulator)
MSKEIEALLIRYFEGTVDPSETEKVEQWRKTNKENERLFRQYRTLWEIPEKISRHKAGTEESLQAVKKRIPSFRKTRHMNFLKYAAAAVFLSLIISSLLLFNHTARMNRMQRAGIQPVIEKITANRGMVTKVTLSDGSEVTLFPGSKLSFPTTFTGKTRPVELSGEGFFSVTHDGKKPFIVKTKQLDVEVLGTKFNVRTGNDEEVFETVLVEGSVRLQEHDGGKETPLITMRPNQRVRYDSRKKKMEVYDETDLEKYIAWTEGRLVFDADSLSEVVRKLEKWYNVSILIKNDQLKGYIFTGKFSDEPVEKVLTLLQLTSDFRFKIHNDSLNHDGYYSKKVIELF